MVEDVVKDIICSVIGGDREDYNKVTDFYAEGYMESVQMMEMILKLEEKFAIEFSDEDLNFDRFKSVKSISEIVFAMKQTQREGKGA